MFSLFIQYTKYEEEEYFLQGSSSPLTFGLARVKPNSSSTSIHYTSRPANSAHCYAELAVSSPVVATTITSIYCINPQGMARLSGLDKHLDGRLSPILALTGLDVA